MIVGRSRRIRHDGGGCRKLLGGLVAAVEVAWGCCSSEVDVEGYQGCYLGGGGEAVVVVARQNGGSI